MADFENKSSTGTEKFHETVSRNALSMWGMQDVAYVRRGSPKEKELWIICAAEGTKLAVAPDRATAMAMVKQSELEPMSVH